jgi:hypothetical protein
MTQEEKELLIKDFSARLPYGVKCKYYNVYDGEYNNGTIIGFKIQEWMQIDDKCIHIEDVKPYLRPMSSMTKEEKEELKSKCLHTETEEDWEGVRCDVWGIQILEKYDTRRWDNIIWSSTINMDAIDWLNSHHFDYRGLIEKNLAIDATDLNIY